MGRVVFDPRIFAWQVTRVPPYVRRAFSSKETGEYRKGTFPARPLYQGVRGSVWERGSEIGADRRRSGPSCVLPKGVPQGQTEYGGIGSPPYAGPPGRAPRGRVTRKRRCTYRPSVRY